MLDQVLKNLSKNQHYKALGLTQQKDIILIFLALQRIYIQNSEAFLRLTDNKFKHDHLLPSR